MKDRTLVAIGCTTDSDYSSLLPLTCLLWREVVGFQPLALLVGDAAKWQANSKAKVALDALDELNIARLFVTPQGDFTEVTMSQCCRLRAAALDFIGDDDWIIPGDADLWPLRKEFYQRHEGTNYKLVSYYWNGDHFLTKQVFRERIEQKRRAQTIPMCHAAMRAKTWREFFVPDVKDVSLATHRSLTSWFASYPRNDLNTWMADQDILTDGLCRQKWFPNGRPNEDGGTYACGDVLFVGRKGHPPVDRLDRENFPKCTLVVPVDSRLVDAHLPRSPLSEHWPVISVLFGMFAPRHATWTSTYRERVVNA
jgi:hypothetical protein